jgi:hypothetical protein
MGVVVPSYDISRFGLGLVTFAVGAYKLGLEMPLRAAELVEKYKTAVPVAITFH